MKIHFSPQWLLTAPFLLLVALFFSFGTAALNADLGNDRNANQSLQMTGTTMGPIVWNVTIADPPAQLKSVTAQTAVQNALDRINRLMSTYQPDSDLSRFNRNDSSDWFAVDAETAAVVARAQAISRLTNGAFDITVGPAVNRWRFGPNKASSFELPSATELDKLKQMVGYRQLAVRLDPPALKKSNPKIEIDLSAIAKGYAVDQVAATLNQLSCKNYMVEVGGEVVVRGERVAGGPWRIAVELPNELTREYREVAVLKNRAMATSGDYRNFEVIAGKRYSHTIDPKTCSPVEHSLASACVVAKDCMTADAVATAVMVLGGERGLELCEANEWELLTYSREQDFGDGLTLSKTASFPLANQSADSASSKNASASETAMSEPAVANVDENVAAIWPVFVGAFLVIALAILGMAVGAIFGNKPVTGSCGGLANRTDGLGETTCGVCAKPVSDCSEVVKS